MEAEQQKAQQAAQMEQQKTQQMQIQQQAVDKEKDRQLAVELELIKAESRDNGNRLEIDMAKMQKDFEIKERELELKQQALNKEGDLTPDGK